MSYLEHFSLEREPFSNAPDSRFYYDSDQHRQALIRLMYAVDSNKGLAVLVGDIGMGKTTLARRMLDNLPEERYESSLLVMVHSGVTPDWILTRIAMQFGISDPAPDRLKLLKQLYDRLLEIDASGKKAVVLIDEAQMLQSRELMEEFRGLLNIEIPGKKLLNIVFFGLREIEDNLQLDEPLAQRVAVKCHLRSLSLESVERYIMHRLKVAGAKASMFAAGAIPSVHSYAGGVPRLINTVCDNALFEASLRKQDKVTAEIIQTVAGDLGLLGKPTAARAPVQVSEPDNDDIDQMLSRLEQGA